MKEKYRKRKLKRDKSKKQKEKKIDKGDIWWKENNSLVVHDLVSIVSMFYLIFFHVNFYLIVVYKFC